jgi:hypothetical protein
MTKFKNNGLAAGVAGRGCGFVDVAQRQRSFVTFCGIWLTFLGKMGWTVETG